MTKTKKEAAMKKVFYLVAVATLVFLSCERQGLVPAQDEVRIFKASIEGFATKANMNSSHQLVWAAGDQIGIYYPEWDDKNQLFTLSSGIGSTIGVFSCNNSHSATGNATVAFFPWQSSGSDNNNVYDGGNGPVMYFKLKSSYNDYTSGKMLTPLVASLNGNADPIGFKHAGAAVKVTINNLPAGANTFIMSSNQQITGKYQINPTQAGNAAIVLEESEIPDNYNKNTIELKIGTNDPSASSRAFTFIFPVPTLTSPNLGFKIKDVNGVTVWSRTASNQSSIGRAQVLELPDVDITTYYSQFTLSDWSVIGSMNNDEWHTDYSMYSDGEYCVLKGMTFALNDEFKVRRRISENVYEWIPSGDNWKITSNFVGTKDVILNLSTSHIDVVPSRCPYPPYNTPSQSN